MNDFSKLKTVAQTYSDLIDSEDQDSLAEARDEYELTARVDVVLELIAEFEIIKSNNADMILRNKVLRERPDLKPDRIACHSNVVSIQSDILKLKQENESLKKDAARYRWLRDSKRFDDEDPLGRLACGETEGEDLLFDSDLDHAIDMYMVWIKDKDIK